MRYSEQPLQSFRLRNFKAVRDSGVVKFSPLTVFIGNNGSGKSSLIEGLETFQSIVVDGLHEAMNKWRGFEFIWNETNAREAVERNESKRSHRKEVSEIYLDNPLRFELQEHGGVQLLEVASELGMNEVRIRQERFTQRVNGADEYLSEETRKMLDPKKSYLHSMERDEKGVIWDLFPLQERKRYDIIEKDDSMLGYVGVSNCHGWQFLNLDAKAIGEPHPTKRAAHSFLLEPDGSNLGDYLSDILQQDEAAFEGIIETLRYVLPYAKDIQTALASELGRQRYLQLSERDFKIPGWLLSTGTLRVLALVTQVAPYVEGQNVLPIARDETPTGRTKCRIQSQLSFACAPIF